MDNENISNTLNENLESSADDLNVSEKSLVDYYDYYYDKVLTGINDISLKEETIISKQDEGIKILNDMLSIDYCIVFVCCIFLLYFFLRNMIIIWQVGA